MQVMEPTGGKILRPKDWFYYEGHRKGAWMCTITKEDTKGGKEKYETGVRIQVFADVSEQTDESAEVFINQFLAQTRKAAKVVHKHCEPETLGFFERTCLEVTKGDYRILYSLFWNNDIDIAVVSIAGAKVEDWEANSKIFDKMRNFELIDLERFDENLKAQD